MADGRIARAFAWVVVALRHVVVLAWIAGAAAATLYLPGLDTAATSPLADLVPDDAKATKVAERSTRLFGSPLYTDTLVVQRDAAGLSPQEQRRTLAAARSVSERPDRDLELITGALPISNAFGLLSNDGERSTTAVTYLFFSQDAGLEERDEDAHKYAQRHLGEANLAGVTGAAPARLEQFDQIASSLPLIEVASALLIALIVGLHFRSLAAPLVTLVAAAVAYLVAVRALAWAGDELDLAVAKEVEPLVVVLLLGLVTDYSVFFMSAMRRSLENGESRLPAARGAAARTLPLVVAAGLIVAGGVAALVVGRLDFFRAFGPSLALTTLVGLVVAVTLIPAAMALAGERLFGGTTRAREASGGRVKIARLMTARPLAALTVAFAVALLVVPATGLADLKLGLSFIRALPDDSEPRQAATAAGEGFAPGIVAPTEVLVQGPGIGARRDELARLSRLLAGESGVATVVGPDERTPPALSRELVSSDGTAARYAVVFDEDPLGSKAIDDLRSIQDRMPVLLREAGLDSDTRVSYGGETALGDETVELMTSDLARIAVVVLAVNLVLLALFMRALVAPLLLLGASVLGLAASLGLTVYFAKHVLGTDELTYYVPFAASVLLVSLGSDYNIFVAGRIWAEARRHRLRDAIAQAAPAAARAIRVAGVALAASFALLAIVPLRSFHEFAFVMAAGILIDTFIVRPLLVTGLIALFGDLSWRPGRPRTLAAGARD